MAQWCSAVGAGVEQGCQCGLFGRIRPRHTQRFISASSILWPKKSPFAGLPSWLGARLNYRLNLRYLAIFVTPHAAREAWHLQADPPGTCSTSCTSRRSREGRGSNPRLPSPHAPPPRRRMSHHRPCACGRASCRGARLSRHRCRRTPKAPRLALGKSVIKCLYTSERAQ